MIEAVVVGKTELYISSSQIWTEEKGTHVAHCIGINSYGNTPWFDRANRNIYDSPNHPRYFSSRDDASTFMVGLVDTIVRDYKVTDVVKGSYAVVRAELLKRTGMA